MADTSIRRRLTTILAADVAGYSRLTGADEEGTVRSLKACRAVIDRLIEAHQGRIFGTAGDSVVAEFASTVEAVRCALAIQRELAAIEASPGSGPPMAFRIGINVGDVMVDGDNLLGDGVNVAARIEGIARPGAVFISGSAYEQVRDKHEFGFVDLGNRTVKNIDRPIPVFEALADPAAGRVTFFRRRRGVRTWMAAGSVLAVAAVAAFAWLRPLPVALSPPAIHDVELTVPDRPSIAVLPFDNLSNDPAQDYFSDGMTEDLITSLSRVSGLFVIARNSVFTYKGRAVNVADVSRDLGVRYVLEGSVRRADARVRITAQLIDATTGFHVWAQRFDRELKDIFALQDEVVSKIVSALEVRLTSDERHGLGQKATGSLEAYDLFLKGFAQFWHFNRAANLAARDLLERAIELDPGFARAYGNLARTYVAEVDSGWSDEPAQALRMAGLLARKAVALDDRLPEVHFVMGLVQMNSREHEAALAEARKAIALNPNYADGYALLAWVMQFAGQAEESLPVIAKAMRLNPRYPFAYLFPKGQAYFALERFAEAARIFKEAANRNPAAQRTRIWLAAAYALSGRGTDAKWEAQELLALDAEFSIGAFVRTVPYKNSAQLDRLAEGLRKAGLPE